MRAIVAQPIGLALDEEVVLLKLSALHLFAHPDWGHASTRPLYGPVLFGLILRGRLGALTEFAIGRFRRSRARIVDNVATAIRFKRRKLLFQLLALAREQSINLAAQFDQSGNIHRLELLSHTAPRYWLGKPAYSPIIRALSWPHTVVLSN